MASVGVALLAVRGGAEGAASTITSSNGVDAAAAMDGERFAGGKYAWKGSSGVSGWWWQVEFAESRNVGALLQVQGEDALALKNAPRRYVWRVGDDGRTWRDLPETRVVNERRAYRLHRLKRTVRAKFLRLAIEEARGEAPVLREFEVFDDPQARVAFPEWAVVVSTLTRYEGLAGENFINLAHRTPEGERLQAQQVWLGDFDPAFVAVEPRPLCAFVSGNFRDWCEVEREPWRGLGAVVRKGELPLWSSCGGAQGIAVLEQYGVDREWDCPHCRDPKHPKTPIYGHIGHTDKRPCGDYSACVFERGPTKVRQLTHDPVFAGVPEEFVTMESHCGQIEWAPNGWVQIAGAGAGAKTKMQAMRRKDRPIYAAQFHIEMDGAPESANRIMGNFLNMARAWSRDITARSYLKTN
jgi:hypothetical protein